MDGISSTTMNPKDNLDQGDQRRLSEDDQKDHRNSNSRKGYKLMFIYNEYLDLMEWFYKNVKESKRQHGIYTFEGGEGSSQGLKGKARQREESNLPYKKRKIKAIRDWPPGCGPAM
ncbi:hypothetical protein R6Q57_002044 [Mikania cordata]